MANSMERPHWGLFVLFCIFGISSWVTINSVFVELPTFSQTLPEGWSIGSYLGLAVQIANIPALAYFLISQRWRIRETGVIYVLLAFGALIGVLLGLFWPDTTGSGSHAHSTHLLVLTLLGGIVDCVSSVVFWPFVSQYRTPYTSALATGEGMSGVAVSMLALVQNQGPQQTFSTSVFFFITAGLMALSAVAFTLIVASSIGRAERHRLSRIDDEPAVWAVEERDRLLRTPIDAGLDDRWPSGPGSIQAAQRSAVRSLFLTMCPPLAHQLVLNFLGNGVLPSLVTYSFLHYQNGNTVMGLSINISLFFNPLACICATFVQFYHLTTLTLVCVGLVAWVVIVSVLGAVASAPLASSQVGPWLMMAVHILLSFFISYSKTIVYFTLKRKVADSLNEQEDSLRAFRWSGFCTQLGSAMGALCMFFLVNYSSVFR